MTTAWQAHALAISSSATTYETASAPAPPQRSGIAMPMSPSSPIRLTVSCGKRDVAVDLGGDGPDLRLGELPRHRLDHLLLVGQLELHVGPVRYFSRSFLNSFVSSGTTSKRSATMP